MQVTLAHSGYSTSGRPVTIPASPSSTSVREMFFKSEPRSPDLFDHFVNAYGQADWDGFEALPITRDTASIAREVFDRIQRFRLKSPPHIAPGVDGTIGFEFHRSSGDIRKLFIEARPDGNIRSYCVRSDGTFEKVPPRIPKFALEVLDEKLKLLDKGTRIG